LIVRLFSFVFVGSLSLFSGIGFAALDLAHQESRGLDILVSGRALLLFFTGFSCVEEKRRQL
jgi:hypothetical protein